ncbi:MAG: aminotransferase class I/II-fold pyridoxal phosphate-dependent enzyme, partial [Streptosporangiales bacterium]|nr:aminotransferase class I/II-fold pyridoxal phosphate-dependent enzyme [Streptosporangiales bacterium]
MDRLQVHIPSISGDHLSAVDLPFHLDRAAGHLGEQLAGQLREALAHGRLTPGERLPSSRAMAVTLGVSRTVVTEAFQQLYAEGWLEGRHGSGTYVAAVAPVPDAAEPAEPYGPGADRPLRADLRAGRTWGAGIDAAAWRRAWRTAATEPVGGWADPIGDAALRRTLAEHLRRTRGVIAPPERILITRGVGAGLDLVAAALLRSGDRAGVEEPGYAAARAVLAGRGAEIVPCPVDRDGLVVSALPPGLRMVYVTPAHQYPLGGRLPVPRR